MAERTTVARDGRWLLALAVALVGCGEDVLDPGEEEDDFTRLYATSTFAMCADCHAPGAPGFVPGETEATQDWSTESRALTTLRGTASGMSGNFAGCNGVPFVVAGQPENSLLFATFDEQTRLQFEAPGTPSCDADAISDHTIGDRVGPVPASTLTLLEDWILAGGPDR